MKKKIIIAIYLCLIFIIVRNYIFPKLHLTFYEQNDVIDYFYNNKTEFNYIAKNIQKKDLCNIEKIDNKIVFFIDKRLESKGIIEKESLYKNDRELRCACEKLFNEGINLQSIWIEEYKKGEFLDVVKIKFIINSAISSIKIQGIYYIQNTKPSSEVKSTYIKLEENWFYFEEDWDDLMGG